MQKTIIMVNKTKQSHTEIPRIKWFPQREVCRPVEAITKKFIIKDRIQNDENRITQNLKPQ
jgi:hypothetical protein